jgi:RNA polymerase sigma-70 factor (ECF subfamily)
MLPCNEEVSDQELAARIQNGDRAAFEVLFRRFYEALCGFVESQVGAACVAEDLVQNVLMNLWRRRQEWEPRTSLRAYLFGAARNEFLQYRAHRQVRDRWAEEEQERDDPPPPLPSPSESVEHRELQREMKKCIAELPERRRQVYVLSRQHGLTYKEIATVMDISPKTVDNQMVEALKFLRKRLRSFSSVSH